MDMMKKKKGQAAIEFLMTYGWMLLVVLIVGALIFSFVDFGSLLPNKVDLTNNLRGDPSTSVAYSKDSTTVADRSQVKVLFRYTGAKRVTIAGNGGIISTELGDTCDSVTVKNLDTDTEVTGNITTPFLNGQDALMTFDCTGVSGGSGLLDGDTLIGELLIKYQDPKSGLEIPSSGSIRLQITTI